MTQARRAAWRRWTATLAVAMAVAATAPVQSFGADDGGRELSRIVAIGDVHGSIDGLTSILSEAGLIDATGHWSGGSATLIQLGDLLDRGVRLREVLDLLMRLELEAPRSGGQVIVLLGNHEAMNLLGITRDVNRDAFAEFITEDSQRRRAEALAAFERLWCRRELELGRPSVFSDEAADQWLAMHPPGFVEYSEAFGPQGVYGVWLRHRPVAAILGDSLFLHGGYGPWLAGIGVDEINRRVVAELALFDETRAFMVAEGLAMPWSSVIEMVSEAKRELEWIAAQPPAALPRERTDRASRLELNFAAGYLMADDGPIWFRGLATWDELEHGAEIASLLDGLGVAREVVGHYPQPNGRIRSRFSGRVLLIDSGMLTSAYGGRASALEIVGDTLTAIYPGERQTIASEPPRDAATATPLTVGAGGG